MNIIKGLPIGKVASYGQIAEAAGNPLGARQVSRLLHSSSEKHGLPWHRVVGSGGQILLKDSSASLQRQLLESEGIIFSQDGHIDMSKYSV